MGSTYDQLNVCYTARQKRTQIANAGTGWTGHACRSHSPGNLGKRWNATRRFVIGEDVGVYGGAFKVTDGLIDEFGKERVIDTPISEGAIVGAACGAA